MRQQAGHEPGEDCGPGQALDEALAAAVLLQQHLIDLAAQTRALAGCLDPIRQGALQARLAAMDVAIEGRRQEPMEQGFIVLAEAVRDLAGRVGEAAEAAGHNLASIEGVAAQARRTLGEGTTPAGSESGLFGILLELARTLREPGQTSAASGRTDPAG